eukprot:TRINITY_DN7312_c0_g4_i2.p1 TRINITY_DN7312_c0_g4~~TRINITY_DN7312_c0_g4_i2.p1  ORF type:complete len:142 (-),score=18.61 TRINITY_DN7312_c0_g4_i2:251-676(-)
MEPIIDKILSQTVPDVLVSNAARINAKSCHELALEDIKNVFNTNTISQASIMARVLSLMLKRNSGHLVTIGSIASFISGANNADYAGSKFALRGWHEAMRMEIRKTRKRVYTTIVHPYIINTTLFKGISSRLSLYFSSSLP